MLRDAGGFLRILKDFEKAEIIKDHPLSIIKSESKNLGIICDLILDNDSLSFPLETVQAILKSYIVPKEHRIRLFNLKHKQLNNT